MHYSTSPQAQRTGGRQASGPAGQTVWARLHCCIVVKLGQDVVSKHPGTRTSISRGGNRGGVFGGLLDLS